MKKWVKQKIKVISYMKNYRIEIIKDSLIISIANLVNLFVFFGEFLIYKKFYQNIFTILDTILFVLVSLNLFYCLLAIIYNKLTKFKSLHSNHLVNLIINIFLLSLHTTLTKKNENLLYSIKFFIGDFIKYFIIFYISYKIYRFFFPIQNEEMGKNDLDNLTVNLQKIKEAETRAEARGEYNKCINIAKKMLLKNKSLDEIIEFTNLTKEEIEKVI